MANKTNRNKAVSCLLAGLMLCPLLSGCGLNFGTGIEDLLRAPALNESYGAVQTALTASLGVSPQLKYPTSGSFRSPFLFGDWDGDGRQDAAVLYTTGSGTNINVAWLYQDENGNWQVAETREGFSGGAEQAQVVRMAEGRDLLVVGYSLPGSQPYLQVYQAKEQQVEQLAHLQYTRLMEADVTGDGLMDLLVINEAEQGSIRIRLLSEGRGTFAEQEVLGKNSNLPAYSACLQLKAQVGRDGSRYLVLDGLLAGGAVSSALLRYDPEQGKLINVLSVEDILLREATTRYSAGLLSRDINGDGSWEMPVLSAGIGRVESEENLNFSFLGWMDFTAQEVLVSGGLYSEAYGLYLSLPQALWGSLILTAGEENETLTVSRKGAEGEEDMPLFALRITGKEKPDEAYLTLCVRGEQRVQVKPLSEEIDRYALQNGFVGLQ